jgi:hypothetical protein
VAEVQRVIAQQGPLPIQVAAQIETDAPTAVTLVGSVWTPNANSMIGVGLWIDDNLVAQAQIFSNQSNEHRAVVPVTVPYTFPWTENQEHIFQLAATTTQTTSDSNDFFYVTVQY